MASNEPMIKLIAKLAEDESLKQINTDIDTLSGSKDLASLKIKCIIDDSSIKNIKNQLSNLKLNVGVNAQSTTVKSNPVTESEVKINATGVKEQIAELKQVLNTNLTGSAKEVMDGLVSQIKEGSTVWTNWLKGADDKLKSFSISVKDATGELTKYNYAINEYGNAKFLGSSGSTKGIEKVQKDIDTFVKQLSSMKRDVGSFTGIYAEIGEGADKTKVTFDSLANSIDSLKNGTKSVAEVRSEMTALKGAVDSVNGVLGNAQGKGFNKFENAEVDARNFDITLEKIGLDLKKLNQSDSVVKDLSSRLKTVTIEANSLANVDEKNQEWANSYQKVNVELKSIQDAIKIVKQLEKQDKSSAAQKTLDNLNKIREAYRDIENYTKKNLSSSIGQSEKKSNSGYILNAKNQVEAAMKELAAEKLITFEVRAQLKEIDKKHNKIMNGLDAKRKDIALTEEENEKTQRRNSILNAIESSLKKIGALEKESANDVESNSDIHKQQIESLNKQVSLNEKRLKTEKLLDDEAKKRIESAKEELNIIRQLIQNRTTEKSQTIDKALQSSITKEINSSINSLSSRSANATFRKNANNAEVQEMIANIEALKSEYQSLFQQLQEDATPQSLVNIKEKLDQLAPKFTETINGASRLGEALRNSSANAKLANDIKNVNNAMDSYAQKNQRVINSTKLMSDGITTFKDKWIELRRLASSNLDTEGLNRLNQEFKNLEQNAISAGIAGESAFKKFANAFKLVSTYISANQIINMVTRQIRSAVSELQNIDDVLTEISKTSDRTDESIRTLGKNSFDIASSYGRTASDYLLGVQEMSRAGFGEKQSETLSELSLRAQAAGDMTAEMANQYIIATNAAYGLEGSEQKLNSVLDSQNYITNRNAVNMESLAEATKISASQAAASGVEINELTSAVGTMIATTQQGGEIAGRAFKGILMNIAQVKADAADIGDGGESITTESLSKYEAATKALGVSLKEVKNGVWALRNPMQVLKELSIAVKKESEDSIKVANLISSVGGKHRGNQLIALLENWETYEKMMSEFASENAVGSAMREAEKSANNWSGSINKLKNSWAKMTDEFINSDTAIQLVNTLSKAIDGLGNSATTGTLSVLIKSLTDIISLLGKASNVLGTIPTLLTSIAAIRSLKSNKGVFGVFIDDAGKATNEITIFGKRYKEIQASINATNVTGFNKVTAGLKAINVQAIITKASVTALNMALTLGISYGVEKLMEGIEKWTNRNKIAAQKVTELKKEQEELNRKTIENAKAYEESEKNLGSLIAQYVKLVSTADDVNAIQSELIDLQKQIVDKYNKEAKGIDLVNKSLEENIRLMTEAQEKANSKWLVENAEGIQEAENFFYETGTGYHAIRIGKDATTQEAETEAKIYLDTVEQYIKENSPEVMSSLFRIGKSGGISILDTADYKDQIATIDALTEAFEYAFKLRKNFNTINTDSWLNAIYELQEKMHNRGLILSERDTKKTDEEIWKTVDYNKYLETINKVESAYKSFNDETASVAERVSAAAAMQDSIKSLQAMADEYPVVKDIIKSALSELGLSLSTVTGDFETAKEVWLKSLGEAQKGVIANVDKIVDAMTKLVSGEALDESKAWDIINMDDNSLLSQITIDENGKYIFDLEQIAKLKDSIIQKEIEERRVGVATAQAKKQEAETQIQILQGQLTLNQKLIDQESRKSNYNTEKLKELNDENARIEAQIRQNESAMDSYNYTIQNENLLIDELTSKTGKLTDTQAMQEAILKRLNAELDSLNKQADGLLKAQTSTIDNIISKQEDELSVLEKQKEALDEQKENLEEILDHYKTVQDVVTSTIDKQIEAIEKEREAIEEYYDKQIKQLQAQNDERETAIEREQKLANLANAKNNKVRVYSEERGFEYVVDQDALKKAQNEFDSFENSEKIKALETEKEKATEGFDERIKDYEEYAKLWNKSTDEITEAEEEQLAQEILGSDWRDKIKNRDTEVIQQFQKAYQNYESSLNKLTKIEMADLNNSIKVKQKEINSWKEYKTSIQDAATALKNANEDYKQYLDMVQINENSTQETRINNLNTFVENYKNIVNQIVNTQKDIDNTTSKWNNLSGAISGAGAAAGVSGGTSVMGGISSSVSSLSSLASGISATASKIGKLLDLFEKKGGAFDYLKAIAQFAITGKLSDETAKNTGLSWRSVLHGARDMSVPDLSYVVATPTAMSSPQGYLANAVNKNLAATTNFNISSIEINGVQNPVEFAQAFETQINRYWQTKLTENKVYQ